MATTKLKLRPDKKGRENELSIYVQVCIDRRVKLYPTGVKVNPKLWDDKNQKVKKSIGSHDHVKTNIILDQNHQTIKDIIFKKVIENGKVTFDSITEELKPEDEHESQFIYWFDKFISDQQREFKASTIKHYHVVKNQILEFKKGKNFELELIDFGFYTNFRNWLIDYKEQRNSTVNKRLKILKTFLRYCSNYEAYDVVNLSKFKMLEEHSSTKIALVQKELDLLVSYDFSGNKRLDKVRDLFTFACVTGLRISDVINLTKANIKDGFIYLNIIKSSQNSGIPLTKHAQAILEKYNYKLPKISGQKINNYLKEIGKWIGIDEEEQVVTFKAGKRLETFVPRYELLSSHVGRRTFITLSILKGIPTPVIQSITGHKDLKSFQKYIQLNNNDKMKAMKLWD
jgi:integrase